MAPIVGVGEDDNPGQRKKGKYLKKTGENQEPRGLSFRGEQVRLSNPTKADACVQVSHSVWTFSFLCVCVLDIDLLCGGLDQGTVCLS